MYKLTLPTDSAARKDVPVYSGVLKYAPAALAGVAKISKLGNDKHNPGEPMHHARGKSNDHGDCVVRHTMDIADILAMIERGTELGNPPTGGFIEVLLAEVSQLSWRALMWSQELHEKYGGAPLAPGAKAASVHPQTAVGATVFTEHVFPKIKMRPAFSSPPHSGMLPGKPSSTCDDPSCWCRT